jgi:hypothetical protein
MFRKNKQKNESRRPFDGGRSSAPVFSYSAQRLRTEDNTERVFRELPKTPSGWLKALPIIVSVIVILGSLLYATTLTSTPRIVVLEGSSSKVLRDVDYYEKEFTRIFGESFFNHSKLTINTVVLAHQIEREYPELENVSVTLPLIGRRPVVQLKAKQPAFILVGKNGSFLIDARGQAIARTQDVTITGLGLTIVTDEGGLEIEAGKVILPQNHVDFITTLLYQLKSKQISVQSVTLPPISNEVHVRLQTKQYFIKFNLQGSAIEQAGTLMAIQERLDAEGVTTAEYIDVRVEDRAYIK